MKLIFHTFEGPSYLTPIQEAAVRAIFAKLKLPYTLTKEGTKQLLTIELPDGLVGFQGGFQGGFDLGMLLMQTIRLSKN